MNLSLKKSKLRLFLCEIVTIVCVFALCCFNQAQAHFLWLVPQDDAGNRVHLYFSEGPEPDNPKLLQKLVKLQASITSGKHHGTDVPFSLSKDESTLSAHSNGAAAWSVTHTYGVFGKDTKNLLEYVASTTQCVRGDMADHEILEVAKSGVMVRPTIDGTNLKLEMYRDGKAAGNLEFELQAPNDSRTLKTNEQGTVSADNVTPGVWAVRVLDEEPTAGELDGQAYQGKRKYTTISFRVPNLSIAMIETEVLAGAPLPEPITSFGAVRKENWLYAYGGNTGGAHGYSNEQQFNRLVRLDANDPAKGWQEIATGHRVQGNAMVADDLGIVVLGGFTAENKKGEKDKLVSQSTVVRYNLADKQWQTLPDLPEPRSSMDAIVLDGWVYVLGGWKMAGDADEADWHTTSWRMNLQDTKSGWKAIAAPPFERRALALAAHSGKIFAVGGMDSDNEPTTATSIYDPATDEWKGASSLTGKPLNGFGAAALELDGQLLVTTMDGSVQRWSDQEQAWQLVGQLPSGRFFHRMLPWSKDSFVLIGGSSMRSGKFRDTTVVKVRSE